MGVARGDGDWHLESVADGRYEVVYGTTTEATITTAGYDSSGLDDRAAIAGPTYEVESYAEAEIVFKQIAAEETTATIRRSNSFIKGVELTYNPSGSATRDTEGTRALLPSILALLFLLTGGVVLSSSAFDLWSPAFYLSGILLLGGICILGRSLLLQG